MSNKITKNGKKYIEAKLNTIDLLRKGNMIDLSGRQNNVEETVLVFDLERDNEGR